MILNDAEIRQRAKIDRMIDPFEPSVVREVDGHRVISYGCSSFGYDIRVAGDFKVFTNIHSAEVDPRAVDPRAFVDITVDEGEFIRIPPNSFALSHSVEHFRIPRDVLAVILGKSTYARCGIIVNCTPAEPEWEGYLTMEISNTTPLPARIYAFEGIAQMLFFAGNPCETSYGDRKGKYQGQPAGIVLPRL